MKSGLLTELWNGMIRLYYPDLCAGCGSDQISPSQCICLDCLCSLPLTGFHRHAGNPIEKIFRGRTNVKTATAYVYFTKQSPVQRILHELKYRGNTRLGYFFGRQMGAALRESDRYDRTEALIPLPLSKQKEKKRGYNQAALLCQGMAESMQLPVLASAVKRTTHTGSQTHRNRAQRWDNMNGTFELADAGAVAGKEVLLVDDVLTTGATLEACAQEILKAPDVRLGFVTLAYTSL